MTGEPETVAQARERYYAAAHAMQSGVAAKMERAPKETEPKHLRTGVNAAMVEHAALIRLLLNTGVINERDYFVALADAMQDEVAMYERELTERLGTEVTLL